MRRSTKGARYVGLSLLVVLMAGVSFGARVSEHVVRSKAMDKEVPVTVILPANYDANASRRWPVAYLLHGYGGDHREYLEKTAKVKDAVDKFGFVAVCPDGMLSSWWVDSPFDPKVRYETFVSKELVAWADQTLRTQPERRRRAILGASMGGYGAMTIGCVHKDVFGAVVSIHGGVELRPFINTWEIADRIDEKRTFGSMWEEFSAVAKARGVKNGELDILMVIGTADQYFLQGNRKLHDLFVLNEVAHTYVEICGKDLTDSSHSFAFQAIGEETAYPFLDRFFRKK